MPEEVVRIEIRGRGGAQVAREFQKAGRAGTRFSSRMKTVGRAMGRWTARGALALGGGLAYAMKKTIDFGAELSKLQRQANLTEKDTAGLRKEIFEMARASNQLPEDVLKGLLAIQNISGDFAYARDAMKDLGIYATAAYAPLDQIAEGAAVMRMNLGFSAKQASEAMNIILKQGKLASIPVAELAGHLRRVTAIAAKFGEGGPEGFKKVSAALQVTGKMVGSTEEAMTALERMSDALLDPKKVKKLQKLSKAYMGQTMQIKDQEGQLLDLHDIILKVVALEEKLAPKGETLFGTVFDVRAARSARALYYDLHRNVNLYEDLVRVAGDGAMTMKDFNTAMRGEAGKAAAAIKGMHIELAALYEETAPLVSALASGLREVVAGINYVRTGKTGTDIVRPTSPALGRELSEKEMAHVSFFGRRHREARKRGGMTEGITKMGAGKAGVIARERAMAGEKAPEIFKYLRALGATKEMAIRGVEKSGLDQATIQALREANRIDPSDIRQGVKEGIIEGLRALPPGATPIFKSGGFDSPEAQAARRAKG